MDPQKPYHKSVLVEEVIQYMAPKPHGVYVDATFGGGGHTRALLEAEPTCHVIALDWDKNAIEFNSMSLLEDFGERLTIQWGDFSNITQLLKKIKVKHIDGIMADFGTSQFQISELPGFSFSIETPLDMRMSPGHFKTTAYDIINRATEQELAQIFFEFGEEYSSRKIAQYIVRYRQENGFIETTKELADVILKVVPRYSRSVHPATKVFQALRIFVNDELNNIKSLLTQSLSLLRPGGRVVCISFHSLEDRIVKQFFKDHKDVLLTLTKKVVTASPEELTRNPSSRSAKLRAAERI